jgi:transcriptional regulator with XRE-family HTH domain
MKDRILEFLKKENKTSAQFAEEIGVQPSGISHIISGRNNPSLDFVIKMLEKYSFLSTDWLIFGKGSMYKEPKMADLFSSIDLVESPAPKKDENIFQDAGISGSIHTSREKITSSKIIEYEDIKIRKIVWFYENNSFEEFYPRKE